MYDVTVALNLSRMGMLLAEATLGEWPWDYRIESTPLAWSWPVGEFGPNDLSMRIKAREEHDGNTVPIERGCQLEG
jgi:hypothetical protein